ncbi:MAG: hypothetical protein EAZ95_18010 [Bacteroidetes bacterium]|nr:MAG: hypothetical protein EAZ95_18010 [Bacteroidota bacterium]
MTKNSVYVFVWDRRTGEQEGKFDYWLNIVSLLSQNAPVFVVQNKIDEGHTEINQQEWKNAFPHIAGFFKTSCATGEGIDALREAIKKQLFALPTTREIWNKYRVAVRTALENHTADFISYKEYLRICETEGLPAQDTPFLAQQLHDIGVILHFADDISLKNTVVLKTDWAIDAAYHLLDTKKVENGRFEVQDLERIWTEARFDEKHDFLLKLIQRFELIFPFQDTQTYIVPEGLSPQSPSFPPLSSASLRFEYHYKFMPKGILSRFICREHRLIKEAFFWKYGVVLEYEQGTQAVVTLWEIDKVLRVEIVGKSASKLLAIIRKSIDDIHNSLKNPPLQEKIPCLCDECKASAKPYLHDYKTLLKFQDKGRETKECNHSAEDVKITQLLEGIENPTQAREKPLHATIQKALSRLEEATYQGYFEEMDKLVLPAYLKGLYSQLKLQFIGSPTSWNFNQQLETFAREANQYL